MPVPAFCQQESEKFGGFPPKRRNWSGIPQHFAWRKRGKAPPFGGALACFAVKREKIGKDGAAEPWHCLRYGITLGRTDKRQICDTGKRLIAPASAAQADVLRGSRTPERRMR